MDQLRAIKGMHDILPTDMRRWRVLEETFREVAGRYGFGEVRTPLVEPTALFSRGVGEATDIVEKEMYSFIDKGEDHLTLRPEGTASAVRAYIEHSVHAQSPVTKWMYLGPMYRRERPAKGRYRQFYQLGAEVYGDPGPFIDAEVIDLMVRFLSALGIGNLEVRLSSLGSGDTHARYREALVAFLTPHREKLSEDSKRRLGTNPLRVLDSKAPVDQEIVAHAPSVLDYHSPEDRAHFEDLRRVLDRLAVPYTVDAAIVRGLDYYTRTVFEVKDTGGSLGAQNTLGAGGRYDGLMKSLGGPMTPAIGFAMGLERLLLALPEAELPGNLDAFAVTAGDGLRTEAAALLHELRAAGIRADGDLRGNSLKSQMRRADASGARFALIVGEDEHARGVVQVRNLATKETVEISRGNVPSELRARLSAK